MKRLPVPDRLDDLRPDDLPWSVKPNWVGFGDVIVGSIIQFAAFLRFPPAVKFMDDYNNVLTSRRFYLKRGADGPPSDATRWHESVHVWQARRFFAHGIRVSCDPRGVNVPGLRNRVSWRGHTEAMAYALNVVRGDRSLDAAAKSLSKPAYATGLTCDAARALCAAYVDDWRNTEGVPDVDA